MPYHFVLRKLKYEKCGQIAVNIQSQAWHFIYYLFVSVNTAHSSVCLSLSKVMVSNYHNYYDTWKLIFL